MSTQKKVLVAVASLIGVAALFWIWAWIQFFTRVPSEHVYVSSTSPDGRKVARFSVKYEGIHPWLPSDIEPNYYVTIVERGHARILLRKSEYHGDLASSFSELAEKYAPWAVDELASADQ